jgi:hypothetical protein
MEVYQVSALLISEQLTLLDSNISAFKVTELLTNLAMEYPDFLEVLALGHSRGSRKVMETTKTRIRLGNDNTSLVAKVKNLLFGNHTILSPVENHIIMSVFFHPRLTDTVRSNVQQQLGYVIPDHRPSAELMECAICGFPQTKSVCQSCREKLRAYTQYRCQSFTIPINHLNFNIRSCINTQGSFVTLWTSWEFHKNPGDGYVKARPIAPGYKVQLELPFPDYQKTIVLS